MIVPTAGCEQGSHSGLPFDLTGGHATPEQDGGIRFVTDKPGNPFKLDFSLGRAVGLEFDFTAKGDLCLEQGAKIKDFIGSVMEMQLNTATNVKVHFKPNLDQPGFTDMILVQPGTFNGRAAEVRTTKGETLSRYFYEKGHNGVTLPNDACVFQAGFDVDGFHLQLSNPSPVVFHPNGIHISGSPGPMVVGQEIVLVYNTLISGQGAASVSIYAEQFDVKKIRSEANGLQIEVKSGLLNVSDDIVIRPVLEQAPSICLIQEPTRQGSIPPSVILDLAPLEDCQACSLGRIFTISIADAEGKQRAEVIGAMESTSPIRFSLSAQYPGHANKVYYDIEQGESLRDIPYKSNISKVTMSSLPKRLLMNHHGIISVPEPGSVDFHGMNLGVEHIENIKTLHFAPQAPFGLPFPYEICLSYTQKLPIVLKTPAALPDQGLRLGKMAFAKGEISFDLKGGKNGQIILLEGSDDMIRWDLLGLVKAGADGLVRFTDPTPTRQNRRFYRALIQ